jgi:hypothetical protein
MSHYFHSPAEDVIVTTLYNQHAAERQQWLSELFERNKSLLLHEGQLSAYGVSEALSKAFGLDDDTALTEAVDWLDDPTDEQLTLMSKDDQFMVYHSRQQGEEEE